MATPNHASGTNGSRIKSKLGGGIARMWEYRGKNRNATSSNVYSIFMLV
jgi:hypothetical protein